MGTGSRHSKNADDGLGEPDVPREEGPGVRHDHGAPREGDGEGNDACALSLTHAIDPVVTPEGVLYDREHILRCLLRQKEHRAQAPRVGGPAREGRGRGGRQGGGGARELSSASTAPPTKPSPRTFGRIRRRRCRRSDDDDESDARRASVSAAQVRAATDEKARRAKELNAFWLPSKTPDAAIRLDRKPETHTICPTTGKKLRMKDLTDVKWTKLPPSAAEDAASRWRYMCPVTRETLTDASRVVVLKPSGAAVSKEAYDKVLAREKEWDGRRIKGVVKLQRGGSGFAASGTQVESKKSFLVGAGSGLADSRGQHRRREQVGLRFN